MKKAILLCLLITFSLTDIYAQKSDYNWYFGTVAGITFNTKDGHPVSLTDGNMSSGYQSSTFSDYDGNLLFYSNGVLILNKNHNVMENGTGLNFKLDAARNLIIIPKPGHADIFYIFSYYTFLMDNDKNTQKGLIYSVVDMSKNLGFGSVVQKNITLYGLPLNSNIVVDFEAIRHKNKKDIWLLQAMLALIPNLSSFLTS